MGLVLRHRTTIYQKKCCISNALDGSENVIVWENNVEDKDDSDWVERTDNDSVCTQSPCVHHLLWLFSLSFLILSSHHSWCTFTTWPSFHLSRVIQFHISCGSPTEGCDTILQSCFNCSFVSRLLLLAQYYQWFLVCAGIVY
jgi:hypothetical protein